MVFQFRGHCIVTHNDLIFKISNNDGRSLNAVFSSRSLESCIISCKRTSGRTQFYRRRRLVFNLFKILLPFLTSLDIIDSTFEACFALVMTTKFFIFQVFSIFCVWLHCSSHSNILIKHFLYCLNNSITFSKSWLQTFRALSLLSTFFATTIIPWLTHIILLKNGFFNRKMAFVNIHVGFNDIAHRKQCPITSVIFVNIMYCF